MNDVFRTAYLELLLAHRRRIFRWLFPLVTALVATAYCLEVLDHIQNQRAQVALQRKVNEQWRGQPNRHPHRASHFGMYAFRPPGVLGFFEPGLSSFAGSMTFLEPHQIHWPRSSAAGRVGVGFGRASPAFCIQGVLPLLLLCLTALSVAGERESGRWSMAVNAGASPGALLCGKALGALWIVLCAAVPVLLVGGLFVHWWSGVEWTVELCARWVLLAGASAVYLGVCAVFGAFLSSLHRRPEVSLLTALSVWGVLWGVVPRAAMEVATTVYPMPARAQLEATIGRAVRQHGDSHDPSNPQFSRLRSETLRRYEVSRVEQLPVNYGGIVMTRSEQLSTEEHRQVHHLIRSIHAQQIQLATTLGAISPLGVIQSLSMALAGTDLPHLWYFDDAVEQYRYQFVQRLNDLHTTLIDSDNDRGQRVSRSHWSDFPPLNVPPPTLGWGLSHVSGASVALGGWAVLLGVAVTLRGRGGNLRG